MFALSTVCGGCKYWRIFLNSAFNIHTENQLPEIVMSLCSGDKPGRVMQTLTAHELGKDQEEFLEKNFKYVFLGKQQSASSSQINTLNMSNACLFPFLGFKVMNKF